MAVAATAALAGCGGEERLSPEAFCDEFVAIGPSAQGSPEAISSELEALAPRAPTPELSAAVTGFSEIFVLYARADREGGDAVQELAALAEDPGVTESLTTFADFLTEECGLELNLPTAGGAPATGAVPAPGSAPATDGTGATE